MVTRWKIDKDIEKKGVDEVDKEVKLPEKIERMPVVDDQVEISLGFDDAVKVVSRDLIKAATDLAVGYDKKTSEVLQSVADKVSEITE